MAGVRTLENLNVSELHFGNDLLSTPYGWGTIFALQGMIQDTPTAPGSNGVPLYYDNARWYFYASGDFLSQDRSGTAGSGSNLYRADGNDPINHTELYPVAQPHDALAARGETPARRRAVDFTRDRGGEARTPLVPARCAALRQRIARGKDTSDARESFTTGC